MVSSYEGFLAAMRREGYEIQTTRNILSFRLPGEGQERFTRTRTLGTDYTEEALKSRIGQPKKRPRRRTAQLQKMAVSICCLIFKVACKDAGQAMNVG